MSSITYRVDQITDQAAWDQMILVRPEANFLQSWLWGVFEQNLQKKVFYLGLFGDDQLVGGAVVVKEEAKRGWYLTVAGGPLIGTVRPVLETAAELTENQNPTVVTDLSAAREQLAALTLALKALALQENCVFVRVRPQLIWTPDIEQLFSDHGYQQSPMHLTADVTLQLDLTQSEDDLLAQMRKNTRYEVRKAEKLGITVDRSFDSAQIQEFFNHQLYLAEKHGFVPFSFDFLNEQFKVFVAEKKVSLFHARYEGKLLASAFIIMYNQEAVYHYGISTPDNDHLPGSYACQWAAIKAAKLDGCTQYNFWGIAPKEQPEHRFAGVSVFKRGFGGVEVPYLPAQDLPTSWQYGVTHAFETVRKKVRKL